MINSLVFAGNGIIILLGVLKSQKNEIVQFAITKIGV